MSLVMLWLRKYGIEDEVVWQTDWGEFYIPFLLSINNDEEF
jgi:hypothetical protein